MIQSSDKGFVEGLISALRARSVSAFIVEMGADHHGETIYVIEVLDAEQRETAKRLLLSDAQFILDLNNAFYQNQLSEIRIEKLDDVAGFLLSRRYLHFFLLMVILAAVLIALGIIPA